MNSQDLAAVVIALGGLVYLALIMRWTILREEQNQNDEDQP